MVWQIRFVIIDNEIKIDRFNLPDCDSSSTSTRHSYGDVECRLKTLISNFSWIHSSSVRCDIGERKINKVVAVYMPTFECIEKCESKSFEAVVRNDIHI